MSDIETYGSYQQTPVVHPAAVYQPAPMDLYGERVAIVYVPDAYGQMVPMRRDQAPAPMQRTPPRDLTPQPLIDPRAQLVFAGGAAAGMTGAGVGWGIGQAVAGIAAFGSSSAVVVIALLLLAVKLPAARGGATTNNRTEVHNYNRGFGRSKTTL